MAWFPNWPHPKMPRGASEDENVEECAWIPPGYLDTSALGLGSHSAADAETSAPRRYEPDFTPKTYPDLGERSASTRSRARRSRARASPT